MAYSKHTWTDGEIIDKDKLNNIEDGIANIELTPGPKGDPGEQGPSGADGKSITAITLTTTGGQVTGGQATMSDESTVPITVTATEG